jgi:HAE1 family hydrophobic/amphiphilic exporter-1
MIIVVFIIFGGMAYFNLPLDQMPNVQLPYVTVQTIYPGAGPKEIEIQVTKKIEDAIATVSNIKTISSFSLENVSIIFIEFNIGEDVDLKNLEVKDKVDGIIMNLPDDVEKPVIQKVDLQALPTVDLILTGKQSPVELYDVANNLVKDKLSQVKGVANVTLTGGAEREIRLELDNATVFENSISLSQFTQIMAANNVDIPAGNFDLDGQQYSVRTKGEFANPEEINDIEIPTATGVKKFGQLGRVVDDAKRVTTKTIYFNNKDDNRNENVVLLSAIKSPDGNMVAVADEVYKLIPQLQKEIPSGMELKITQDRSEFIRDMVSDTLSNIIMGVILTAIVLLLFIGELRSTFIIALAMPISIISTFWLLDLYGYSLNMMTLMGISTSVGVLVANSIVVIENIFRFKEMGYNKKDSAAVGTQEVLLAVMASTLTNLVVFIPLATMGSMIGQFLSAFAWTVVFATVFSLIVSLTITPMLAGIILPKKFVPSKFNRAVSKFVGLFEKLYSAMLSWVLKNKKNSIIVSILSVVILIVTIMFSTKFLAFELFPEQDQGYISVTVELPEGYYLDETGKITYEIEKRISRYAEVETITTTLGRTTVVNQATSLANMTIKLIDSKERVLRVKDLVAMFIKDVSDIPNAKIIITASSGFQEGGPQNALEFSLIGNNLDTLEKYKEIVIQKLIDVPGLTNFDNTSRQGSPEITIVPDRKKLAEAGVTIAELGIATRGAVEGIIANKYREKGNEYDVTITMSDMSYNTPEKVGMITVTSSVGQTFQLNQLADIKFTKGYTKILHEGKSPTINFTGYPGTEYVLGQITGEVQKRLDEIKLPEGYQFKSGGGTEMMEEATNEMMTAILLAIILTYMLLAALLEHLVQPLIILTTVPLALIGVLIALVITGKSLSIVALLAVIMMIGIVVNNAILILDYSNQLVRDDGLSHREALLKASPIKLRPILMSTIAIMFGMFPMAMGIGDKGAEMRQPLGIVQIGGMLASMILCLFIVPALDYLVDEFYKFMLKLFKKKPKVDRLSDKDNKARY